MKLKDLILLKLEFIKQIDCLKKEELLIIDL